MILAGIDIGTNTLRLLVAETGPDSFHIIHADRKVTRLGQDLDRTGVLSREAEERTLKALGDFVEQIRRTAALHTAAIGTSALRTASNATAFISRVKLETGLDIRVITGEEEAELALIGVVRALKGTKAGKDDLFGSALIIDIGGGSTELIRTHTGEKPKSASLALGAVYLTDRFIKNDPPTQAEMELLRGTIKHILEQRAGEMKSRIGGAFIGTAGTITTLAAMDLKLPEYDPDRTNGHTLNRKTVDAMVLKLAACTLEERRSIPGLERGREDIILAGAVITQELMNWFGVTTLVVSDWGLREGIVLDLTKKLLKGPGPQARQGTS